MKENKTLSFEIKAVDEETGLFEGYAATFSDKPDSYGDIIDPGAFSKTLKEAGNRVKILWNHDVREPIGKPAEIKEDKSGLFFKGKLSLGVQRAREVLALMKDGVITEMSIGYDAVKAPFVDGVRHLKEIKLWDISPVTFAANPEAVIMGVKQSELKPYPSEHACRLKDPGDFQEGSFRRTTRVSDGKKYSIIMGRLKDEETMTEQAYRYDKEVWTENEARTHCGEHDGTFEAAEKQDKYDCECIECGHKMKSEEHCSDIKCPECGGNMRRVVRPGPGKSLEEKAGRVLSAASMDKLRAALEALGISTEKSRAALEALEALVQSAESEPEKSTLADEQAAILENIEADINHFDIKLAEARIAQILDQIKEVKPSGT